MSSLEAIMESWSEMIDRTMRVHLQLETRELKKRCAERDRLRGVAMSDALYELKKAGKTPTIYEVQKKADELQSMWRFGVPLLSERHPWKVRVEWQSW